MFEAIISHAILLKKIVESIKDVAAEVNLEVSSRGISVEALDSLNIALVILKLNSDRFDEFRCDRPLTLGISMTGLSKLLKLAKNEDEVILRCHDEACSMTFLFRSQSDMKICEFNFNLITIEPNRFTFPGGSYQAACTIPSAEFARVCRDLSLVTDSLNIFVDKGCLKFNVAGNAGAGSVCITPKNCVKEGCPWKLRVKRRTSIDVAIRYLNLFNRAAALTDEVEISLSPEAPMALTYEFDLGYIKYFLASKIIDA